MVGSAGGECELERWCWKREEDEAVGCVVVLWWAREARRGFTLVYNNELYYIIFNETCDIISCALPNYQIKNEVRICTRSIGCLREWLTCRFQYQLIRRWMLFERISLYCCSNNVDLIPEPRPKVISAPFVFSFTLLWWKGKLITFRRLNLYWR